MKVCIYKEAYIVLYLPLTEEDIALCKFPNTFPYGKANQLTKLVVKVR